MFPRKNIRNESAHYSDRFSSGYSLLPKWGKEFRTIGIPTNRQPLAFHLPHIVGVHDAIRFLPIKNIGFSTHRRSLSSYKSSFATATI